MSFHDISAFNQLENVHRRFTRDSFRSWKKCFNRHQSLHHSQAVSDTFRLLFFISLFSRSLTYWHAIRHQLYTRHNQLVARALAASAVMTNYHNQPTAKYIC